MRKIDRPDCPNPEALTGGNYKHPNNKSALRDASFGKCMYCESAIDATYAGDIEHIRPKSRWPDLEFEWSNLGFCCWHCNNRKGNQFDENYPFINPYDEDPRTHFFACGNIVLPRLGDERAEGTINAVDLNRQELRNRRDELLYYVKSTAESALSAQNPAVRAARLNALASCCNDDAVFSLICQPIVQEYLKTA